MRKSLCNRACSIMKSLAKTFFNKETNSLCHKEIPLQRAFSIRKSLHFQLGKYLCKEPFPNENPFTKSFFQQEILLQRAFSIRKSLYNEPVTKSLFNNEILLWIAFSIGKCFYKEHFTKASPFTKSLCTRQAITKLLNQKP